MKRASYRTIPAALLAATALVHGQNAQSREMILTDGQAVVMSSHTVETIPLNQTPAQLQAALNADWTKH